MPNFTAARPSTCAILIALTLVACIPTAEAAERVLTAKMQHLRSGAVREWADFPEAAEGPALRLTFPSSANATEHTLRLRHRDVKQTWKLRLNDREIGRLPPDENDMVTFWSLPAGTLREGENIFAVSSDDKQSDDVMIGDVRIDDRPRRVALSEAQIEVSVNEAGSGRALPCRLTVVNPEGALIALGAESREGLAVRPGVIYTANGAAHFGVPAGRYTVYAGRGFEYGVAKTEFDLRPGETAVRQLTLRREVPTEGYVACDTHCHTLTFSGHGDATLDERVVTIAGEGIELPIATDHNRHADYESAALAAGVRSVFTPVVGNEVTTPRMGHFNIFPIHAGAKVVNHGTAAWPELFREIRQSPDVSVIVLNHPRDLHGGYCPFGPDHHLSLVGENLDGWKLEANALEVVNSGALQTDVMQVYRDWFGLLNRGFRMTPVGASDSHDVARYFVGQGRTYIRCDDRDPGTIDVAQDCRHLAAGRALVSMGLLCEIVVAGRHGPGDLVDAAEELDIALRVLGPSWSRATNVALYANGVRIREAPITEADAGTMGVKWNGNWRLPRLRHDVHLAAIATGPGVKEPFWPTPRPYQPTSPVWYSYVVGSTGAVWVDADGSGDFTSAFEYASRLVAEFAVDFSRLMKQLADYDEAVAAQAARILHVRQLKTPGELLEATAQTDSQSIKDGFRAYVDAWKECEVARAQK
jgi:hypothetical protein